MCQIECIRVEKGFIIFWLRQASVLDSLITIYKKWRRGLEVRMVRHFMKHEGRVSGVRTRASFNYESMLFAGIFAIGPSKTVCGALYY